MLKGADFEILKMNLVCVSDYEKEAKKRLGSMAWGFFSSGATAQRTLLENETSLQKWHIRPRMLRDVSQRDMSTTILGIKVPVPLGVSPTAFQKMAHPDGECANVRAAGSIGAPFTLSTCSTDSMEEVAEASPNAVKFFQLYVYKERNITKELMMRAEKAGYKAIVLTVDAPVAGIRYANMRSKFLLPPHLTMANFKHSPEVLSILTKYEGLYCEFITWKDIPALKSMTSLPIVLKGILTGEDAELALEAGASAIWVSNHGARQIDGVLPSMDALEEVVAAVKGRCEVYVDGGFRTGSDVFKALALGARMVFLGRPPLWGLACNGEEGARNVLDIVTKELDNVMANAGCQNLQQIQRQMVTKALLQSNI